MSESMKIKLADKEYVVRKLTLRQGRAIGVGVCRPVPPDDGFEYAIDQAISVVAAALSRDHPEMTVDAVLDAEVSPREMMVISGTILEFSGFIKAKDNPPGEAAPGAA